MTTFTTLVSALALCACIDSAAPSLIPAGAQVDPEIRRGCALASRLCAQCHSYDRVNIARGVGPSAWGAFVEEMRLKPSSGISVPDASSILRCMIYLEPPPRKK